jgi:mono/diheme cytochrome c family protein
VTGALVVLVAIGAAAFLFLTRARPLNVTALPDHAPDVARGEVLFNVGSCGECHKAADDTPGAKEGLPTGTAPFNTPIGVFYAGNLTPDPDTGLGRWSQIDFVNAVTRGLSPEGTHYFPAFPYPSYSIMPLEDVLDLHAYLMSLPGVRAPKREADVPMPALARRGVGLWNRLSLAPRRFAPDPGKSESWNRGAYLTNGPGHCGECHTPRNLLMIADDGRHLAGGRHPAEDVDVPSLRGLVEREKYSDAADLTLALQYGETFGYDGLSSGGMAAVQMNLALLPESDVQAISEYLVSLD